MSWRSTCPPRPQSNAPRLAGLARLFAADPKTPVIVNHVGMVIDRAAEALAALPQVGVKISGMGFVDSDWTRDTRSTAMRDYVLETIDIFGPARAMIASDSRPTACSEASTRHSTPMRASLRTSRRPNAVRCSPRHRQPRLPARP